MAKKQAQKGSKGNLNENSSKEIRTVFSTINTPKTSWTSKTCGGVMAREESICSPETRVQIPHARGEHAFKKTAKPPQQRPT